MTRALAVIGAVATAAALTGCGSGTAGDTKAGAGPSTPVVATNGDPSPMGSSGGATSDGAVAIASFKFAPTPVRVAVGTTLTWTNEDDAPHSVVSSEKGVFSSPDMTKGQTFTFTPQGPGSIAYVCGIHNYMTGQIVVV